MVDLEILDTGGKGAVDEDVALEISRQSDGSRVGLTGPYEQALSGCSGAAVVDVSAEEPCTDSARVGTVAGPTSCAEAV